MGEKTEAFLQKIGPRALTHEEARELYLLKLEEGEKPERAGGVARRLASKRKKDDTAGTDDGGGINSKFLK